MKHTDCHVGMEIRGPSGTRYTIIAKDDCRVTVLSSYPHSEGINVPPRSTATLDWKALLKFKPVENEE